MASALEGDQTQNVEFGQNRLEGQFYGTLDEVRISDTARSTEWGTTEYNNQNSPGTFCTVGSEEEVDTTPPTVSNVTSVKADGIYTTGEVIDITVTFSEAVTVTGSPYLELETGDTDRNAAYHSGTGTTALAFRYAVQAGDTSNDLDYKATNSLQLDGGTIKDAAGNDATLTLAAPGQANSLGANKALLIDANAPDTASVTTPADGATYNATSMPTTFSGQVGDDANGAGMDANSATFYIKKGSEYWNGTSWTTVTWLATTHTATIDDSEVAWTDAITLPSWTDGQTYEVKAKATDKAGNTFEGTAVTFTYDTTTPAISSGTVAADNSYIDVAFSEGVYNTDGGSGALEASDFSLTFTQGSGTATNVTIASLKTTGGEVLSGGETTIRVMLTVTGSPNGQETIEVKPAADSIYDKAGNAASITTTTGTKNLNDQAVPMVTSFFPADDATDVAIDTNLVMNFSENVVAGTGNIVIYKSDDTLFESIPVGDPKVSIVNNIVTINPADTFASETSYYVQIAATCFDDTSGNSYAGISDKTTWNFTSVTAVYQPDNQIRNRGEETYIGDNTYNTTGADQTKSQTVDNSVTATYEIKVENDSNAPDTLNVSGTAGGGGWTITYYDALSGGSDITSDVIGGGWSTGLLAPGASKEIRVEVTPDSTLAGGSSKEVLVTSTSAFGDASQDAVKAVNVTSVLPGDANSDGVVNALDITKVERIIGGLDAQTLGADANQDGNINALDITKVERIIAGLG